MSEKSSEATVMLQILPNPKKRKMALKVPLDGTPLGIFTKELCAMINVPHAHFESEISVYENGQLFSALDNGISHAMPGDTLHITMRKVTLLSKTCIYLIFRS